jgi:hypothetical protein
MVGNTGKLLFGADVNSAGSRLVSAGINGAGDVVISGGSGFSLEVRSVSAMYTGATNVNSGTLRLSGAGLYGTSVFRLASSARLEGHNGGVNLGIVTTIYGTLSPGFSAASGRGVEGELSFGSLVLAAAPEAGSSPARLEYNFSNQRFDLIKVGGSLTLDPANTTVLAILSGRGDPGNVGDVVPITVDGSVIPDDGIISGPNNSRYQLDYNYPTPGNAPTPYLTAVALIVLTPGPPVPEPASGLLFAAAAIGMLRRRRRKDLR